MGWGQRVEERPGAWRPAASFCLRASEWVVLPCGIASHSGSREREEAEARNSWFQGPGAKEVAPWPGCWEPGFNPQWQWRGRLGAGSLRPSQQECVPAPGEGAWRARNRACAVTSLGEGMRSPISHASQPSWVLQILYFIRKTETSCPSLSDKAGPPQICPEGGLACGGWGSPGGWRWVFRQSKAYWSPRVG